MQKQIPLHRSLSDPAKITEIGSLWILTNTGPVKCVLSSVYLNRLSNNHDTIFIHIILLSVIDNPPGYHNALLIESVPFLINLLPAELHGSISVEVVTLAALRKPSNSHYAF